MQEETVWIKKAKEGNQRAFRELYDANAVQLYRFLRQFAADPDQVEEWVQRAFIKAFRHIGSFQGSSRFSSWLFRLGLNEMKMDVRRKQIVAFVPAEDEHEDLAHEEERFEWNQMMKLWTDELDENKRGVFILYEVEGYSHAEIASMLGIAESSSRTLLTRAKRFLQERWNRENLT